MLQISITLYKCLGLALACVYAVFLCKEIINDILGRFLVLFPNKLVKKLKIIWLNWWLVFNVSDCLTACVSAQSDIIVVMLLCFQISVIT